MAPERNTKVFFVPESLTVRATYDRVPRFGAPFFFLALHDKHRTIR